MPRAGLLGSLTAIALVFISFLPLLDIAALPVAGFVALMLTLATLTARWQFPRQFPGALGALCVGVLALLRNAPGWMGSRAGRRRRGAPVAGFPGGLADAVEDWLSWFARSGREAIGYLAGGDSAGPGDGGRRN